MTSTIKPIETFYRGYRFRSRLEARWAVFFDALSINWDYEPQGYQLPEMGAYLPDFFLHFEPEDYDRRRFPNAGKWIEIKPLEPSGDELLKLGMLSHETRHRALLLVGVPGAGKWMSVNGWRLGDKHSMPTSDQRPLVTGDGWYVLRPEGFGSFGLEQPATDPDLSAIDQFAIAFRRFVPGGCGPKDVTTAIDAARSARFEHGETP